MKVTKKTIVSFVVAAMAALGAMGDMVSATSFAARQRYPWNGLVDIWVAITGASNDVATTTIDFSAVDGATGEALPVTQIAECAACTGSGTTWTRKFVWNSAADLGAVRIGDVALTVEVDRLPGVQLWKDGPYWAECNVGATKPEEYGYSFRWGDAAGYKRNASNDGWVSVETGESSMISDAPTSSMTPEELLSQGYTDSTGNLACEFGDADEIREHGVTWRMPTGAEFGEISNNCTVATFQMNSEWGLLITGKGDFASNHIFLPSAGIGSGSKLASDQSSGFYWSSTAPENDKVRAIAYAFPDRTDYVTTIFRYYGCSIRPVRKFTNGGDAVVHTLSTHLEVDTRTGTRLARLEEPLAFSTDWGSGVTKLTLSADGVEVLASNAATNGIYVWRPDFSTPRTVTLTHETQGDPNEVLSATFEIGVPYLYVDATQGNDAENGTSSDKAVKTLTRAYELAVNDCIILVAAGTYGSVTATGKTVTFRAKDGATIDGNGTARCVTADEGVVFENFTLINGYDATRGGGACGGTFEHCTITNCTSGGEGGGAYGATLRDCMVTGNTAANGGGVSAPGTMHETIFRGNTPENMSGGSATVAQGGTFVYAPAADAAYTIPHEWFVKSGLAKYGDPTADLAALLKATHACGMTGWGAYVAGVEPNNAASAFTANMTLSNGVVYVGWSPDLNTNGVKRIYTVSGRASLDSYDWDTTIHPWHRFFRVSVDMPKNTEDETTDLPDAGFEQGELGGVQLWKDGPYWAECNVGATKPEEVGYRFWWGDTVGYLAEGGEYDEDSYSMTGVSWRSSAGELMSECPFVDNDAHPCPTGSKTIAQLRKLGYINASSNLVEKYDGARRHLGPPWRMPSKQEISDLIKHTSMTWVTTNGVSGMLATGLLEYSSRSIFLPVTGIAGSLGGIGQCYSSGYYWSATVYPSATYFLASNLRFFHEAGSKIGASSNGKRWVGCPIRPIRAISE